MSGTSVSIKVDTSEVRSLFDRTIRKTSDFSLVMEEARAYLGAANAANFTSGGLPVGGWAPLAPKTVMWKVKHGQPATPLIGNGRLFESLSTLQGPPNHVGPTGAQFGTDIEYAQFHQSGAPRANLPKRQIVFTPPGFAQMIAQAGAKHIDDSGSISDFRALFR